MARCVAGSDSMPYAGMRAHDAIELAQEGKDGVRWYEPRNQQEALGVKVLHLLPAQPSDAISERARFRSLHRAAPCCALARACGGPATDSRLGLAASRGCSRSRVPPIERWSEKLERRAVCEGIPVLFCRLL